MTVVQPAKLLVVDDVDSNRDLVVRILAQDGHQLATASDGEEALEKLREETFDLVLLDVMMPRVDGIQVIEAMRADDRLKRLPVIMLSALHEQETVLRCIELGADDYLPKPINRQLLRARIATCLDRKRLFDLERQSALRAESASTQLQAANERLRQANQLKSRFLATAAHDLKNPLGGILLLADRIREQAEGGGAAAAITAKAGRIRDVAEKMVQIINGILDTAVQEPGEVAPVFETVNFGDLVHGVVKEHELYAASKDIRLHYREFLAGACWGSADPVRFAQAIDNLVNNAIKYSPIGREIWVDLALKPHQEGERLRIEVRDQGPGLTQADKEQAFRPFQRLSATPTGGEYSTGLGLSIVKQMIELHGGQVWIESEPGRGSAFIVEIPLQGRPAKSGEA